MSQNWSSAAVMTGALGTEPLCLFVPTQLCTSECPGIIQITRWALSALYMEPKKEEGYTNIQLSGHHIYTIYNYFKISSVLDFISVIP